jgi:hypothetical protein
MKSRQRASTAALVKCSVIFGFSLSLAADTGWGASLDWLVGLFSPVAKDIIHNTFHQHRLSSFGLCVPTDMLENQHDIGIRKCSAVVIVEDQSSDSFQSHDIRGWQRLTKLQDPRSLWIDLQPVAKKGGC